MRLVIAGIAMLALASPAAGQPKKNLEPAPLPVAVNTGSVVGTVLVTWPSVQKAARYELTRCEGTTACALKSTLTKAPLEYRDSFSASGTYLYRVTAFGSNQLPLAQGQVAYVYTAPAPVYAVLMPPPSGTITPITPCTTMPTSINMGTIRVSIQSSAPMGADVIFETWQDPDIVGHTIDRAPAGTNPQGTAGWTLLTTTCDGTNRLAPITSPYGLPAYWFRDVSGGLTFGASYQYRARAVSSKGYHIASVSPPWQAPAPIPPFLQPPTKPTAAETADDDIVLWLHWDQPLIWNGTAIRPPDEWQIAGSWGFRGTLKYYRACPCAYPIRTTDNMPTGQQTIYVTSKWGSVSATVSQWVTR